MRSATFIFAAILSLANGAQGATITGFGSPLSALPGGTVIDFESVAVQNYSAPFTVLDVTFSANTAFSVSPAWSGQYNTSGNSLQSPPGYPGLWRFDFSAPVSGFAFNMGAHDVTWYLDAYASDNALLGHLAIGAIQASNAGQYYGISSLGIAYAVLTAASSGDYVLIDNFTYQTTASPDPTPLPAALPLFATILGGAGVITWRRRKRAAPPQL